DMLHQFREHWGEIQNALIDAVDRDYGVYLDGHFSEQLFERYLAEHRIPWPRFPTGRLELNDKRLFRQMAKAFPILSPLRELKASLSKFRLFSDLAVGRDGRNRVMLSAFGTKTGRNKPSNAKFIFGPAVWLRGLIKPPPGYAIAYLDFEQQEIAIAAVLSGDTAMQRAYQTGDFYLAFAILAGAVPADATKESHGEIREQFKQCALGMQYGMEADSLAMRIGVPRIVACDLIRAYREHFRVCRNWSESIMDHAMMGG